MADDVMDSVIHQAAVAIAAAHVIELAKRVPFLTWLQNPIAAKIVAVGAVTVGALGVHWQLTGSLDAGGQIVIAWPMLSTMIDAGEHLVLQWALQEGYYQRFVKPQQSIPVTLHNPPPPAPSVEQVAAAKALDGVHVQG